MRNRIIRLAVIALLASTLLSCIDESNATGTVSGYVYMYDSLGIRQKSSAGINVTIDNTNISTQSDSLGHYSLTGVKEGIYSISFTQTGYALNKLSRVQFIGKDEYYCKNSSLIQLPKINAATNAKAISNSVTDSVSMTGVLTSTQNPKRCRIFFSKIRPISSNPDRWDAQVEYNDIGANDLSVPFQFFLKKTLLMNFGYKPGQTLYAIIYPECKLSTCYQDLTLNKTVYTSLGTPSLTLLVTVPD